MSDTYSDHVRIAETGTEYDRITEGVYAGFWAATSGVERYRSGLIVTATLEARGTVENR